jgi:hypothetical protein
MVPVGSGEDGKRFAAALRADFRATFLTVFFAFFAFFLAIRSPFRVVGVCAAYQLMLNLSQYQSSSRIRRR